MESSLESLIKAIQEGKLNVVQKLIAINKKLVLEKYNGSISFEDDEIGGEAEELLGKDMTGMNSIHIALMSLDIEDENVRVETRKKIIDELIQALPHDINLSDYRWGNNNTTLHLASFLGEKSIINKLLGKGEDPSQKNDLGKTSIDVAADYEISDYLNEINNDLIEKRQEELERKESLLNTLKKCEDIELTLQQNKKEKIKEEAESKSKSEQKNENENENENNNMDSIKSKINMEEEFMKKTMKNNNNISNSSINNEEDKEIQNSNETITCETSNPLVSGIDNTSNNTINNAEDSNPSLSVEEVKIDEKSSNENESNEKELVENNSESDNVANTSNPSINIEEVKEDENKDDENKDDESMANEDKKENSKSNDRSKLSNLIDMDMINNLISSQTSFINVDSNENESNNENENDNENENENENESEDENENESESESENENESENKNENANVNINENKNENENENDNENDIAIDTNINNSEIVKEVEVNDDNNKINNSNSDKNNIENNDSIKSTIEKFNQNNSAEQVNHENKTIKNSESVISKKDIYENNSSSTHETNKIKDYKLSSSSFNNAKEKFSNNIKSSETSTKESDSIKAEIMGQKNTSIKSIINNINHGSDENDKLKKKPVVIGAKDNIKATITNINKNKSFEDNASQKKTKNLTLEKDHNICQKENIRETISNINKNMTFNGEIEKPKMNATLEKDFNICQKENIKATISNINKNKSFNDSANRTKSSAEKIENDFQSFSKERESIKTTILNINKNNCFNNPSSATPKKEEKPNEISVDVPKENNNKPDNNNIPQLNHNSIKETISNINKNNGFGSPSLVNESIKRRESLKSVKPNEKSENVEPVTKKDTITTENELSGSIKKRGDISKLIQAFNHTPDAQKEPNEVSSIKSNTVKESLSSSTTAEKINNNNINTNSSNSSNGNSNNSPIASSKSYINSLKSTFDNNNNNNNNHSNSTTEISPSIIFSKKNTSIKIQLLSSKFLSNSSQNNNITNEINSSSVKTKDNSEQKKKETESNSSNVEKVIPKIIVEEVKEEVKNPAEDEKINEMKKKDEGKIDNNNLLSVNVSEQKENSPFIKKQTSKIDSIKNTFINNNDVESNNSNVENVIPKIIVEEVKEEVKNPVENEKLNEMKKNDEGKIDNNKNLLSVNMSEQKESSPFIKKQTSKIDSIKNAFMNNMKEEQKEQKEKIINTKISESKIESSKPLSDLPEQQKDENKKEEQKENITTKVDDDININIEKSEIKNKPVDETTSHESLNISDVINDTTISSSDLTLNESNDENKNTTSKLKEKSKIEDDYTSAIKPDYDFSLQLDSFSLDLPTIASVTLSLDEIFVTQDMNFGSMFSDFDINKSSNDTPLKEIKATGKSTKYEDNIGCSDNTLYSETESNESLNKPSQELKETKFSVKKDNKAQTTPVPTTTTNNNNNNNKEKPIETVITKKSEEFKEEKEEKEKKQQQQINKKSPEIAKPEKPITTTSTTEEKKNENDVSEKIKAFNIDNKSKEEFPPCDDLIISNEKAKPNENEIKKKEKPITQKEAENFQQQENKNTGETAKDEDINENIDALLEGAITPIPKPDESMNMTINNENESESEHEHEQSDNENSSALEDDINKENDKHANMILKEKLYEEQKNHNKIGLLKTAELLSTSSLFSAATIKKSKPKQKSVQFKSSWSGELESTKRMSKDKLNYISTSKGNFIFKLNRMDIKSTCPVFFSGNFENDSIYTMFCEFKCDDEVYYTTKQYPIHSNNPTISMNEDINIPLTSDQNTMEINVMMIKKTPLLMPNSSPSKSSKNSSSNGMSTLTRTMTHSKKTIHQLMFWKKNKNMDGFNSVNTSSLNSNMMNFNGYDDMNSSLRNNDLQFRSLSSNSSISKMFIGDGTSSTQSNHRGRNYHPSIKTIFNNTSNTNIPSPSNGLSRESTMDNVIGSNCSLNSSYSTNTTASNMTTSSSSSSDNIFVAGKLTIDLKNLREQHMGELIDDTRWEITPPKPLMNSSTNSELPPIGSVRIRKKVMQWDGLDAPLVILNGKLNMSLFYIPEYSYKEDLFVPKTISDCLDCVECQRWHETETKTGYLRQKGGDVNDWKRRFYRLIGEKLIAYDSENSESTATIDLTQCKFINLLLPDPQNSQFINETLPNGEEYTTIVYLNSSASSNENYIFELVFKDDDAIEFKCDTLDDMNAWCKELQIVVQEWEEFQYPNWWTELINFKEEELNKNC